MLSYFVIEKGDQVISEGDRFFFLNGYGIRTLLKDPPQNGFPAYYKQTENNPAQENVAEQCISTSWKKACAP